MIFIDEDRCSGCGDCLEACPEGAIALQDDKAIINHELCSGCADCLTACSEGAIYEVEAVPAVVEPPQPTAIAKPPPPRQARPVIVSALAAAAPLALDFLGGLARRWLDQERPAKRPSGQPGPGGSGRRRRRRARGRR